MSIKVKNIDPILVKKDLKESDCELCKKALQCIEAFERISEIQQETTRKAIAKIRSQSKRIKQLEGVDDRAAN